MSRCLGKAATAVARCASARSAANSSNARMAPFASNNTRAVSLGDVSCGFLVFGILESSKEQRGAVYSQYV